MKIKNLALTLCASLLLTSMSGIAKEVKIGMAIDDLRLERWQKDRDIFVKKAESLGAKVFVQSANGNEETQMSQIENMINRGVDVLVIIPYNGQVLSNVVAEAKREGIKVLAYDRMINNADIDFYISFDNEKVGELQAKALVDKVPQGVRRSSYNRRILFRERPGNLILQARHLPSAVGWDKDWQAKGSATEGEKKAATGNLALLECFTTSEA